MKRSKILAAALTGMLALTGVVGTADKASAASPDHIVSTAKSLIGVPYCWGGTTTSGFDCSGFVRYVFAKDEVSLPRTAYDMYQQGKPVSRSALRRGDVVFFKTASYAPVTHTGVYIGNGKFVHASSSKGVSISNVDDRYYWGQRYVGAKRL
ncbi:cell wall-associated NlpC family hydrolase [Aneurinibacillus soli]|uniref:Peptidoglycan endopeptidase LytF n=1 Tax=Aneurinibacillus soli TaxID=1500254 RepID=A0A0U5AZK3_9BACL|nr:C40 family peptidase [Aneurinibacillus soli]PYE59465.1 cell wall-associated NlpC family hydrolase [Aneurinibacillus soli]BAU29205.1 Peptidoglycan endopeptidase LytF precursor [Aneurinibacillus soli]